MSLREAFERDWDHFAGARLPSHAWVGLAWLVKSEQACRHINVLPGASKFWSSLQAAGHHVRVCTSPLPNCPEWMSQRAAWLQMHFGIPPQQQIHMHDKADLAGAYDVLIDDKPKNCELFVAAGGRAYCIAQPYNMNVATPRGDYAACLTWLAALATPKPEHCCGAADFAYAPNPACSACEAFR